MFKSSYTLKIHKRLVICEKCNVENIKKQMRIKKKKLFSIVFIVVILTRKRKRRA